MRDVCKEIKCEKEKPLRPRVAGSRDEFTRATGAGVMGTRVIIVVDETCPVTCNMVAGAGLYSPLNRLVSGEKNERGSTSDNSVTRCVSDVT